MKINLKRRLVPVVGAMLLAGSGLGAGVSHVSADPGKNPKTEGHCQNGVPSPTGTKCVTKQNDNP